MTESIRVFGSRKSPYVEKVYRAARIKGLDVEFIPLSKMSDFKKYNPITQKMPVAWIGDDDAIYDSTRILARLDELVPTPALYSQDPESAAKQRMLEDWADESLYWWIMARRWAPENQEASAQQILGKMPKALFMVIAPKVKKSITGMTHAQGCGRLPKDVLLELLGARLDDLVTQLGKGAFFFSEQVGGADIALFSQLRMGQSGPTPEIAELLESRRPLMDYIYRVAEASS